LWFRSARRGVGLVRAGSAQQILIVTLRRHAKFVVQTDYVIRHCPCGATDSFQIVAQVLPR
jgi:hypothetical protein